MTDFKFHPGRRSTPTREIVVPEGEIPSALTCASCKRKFSTTFALVAHECRKENQYATTRR